jgi:hypothetical protein
MPTPKATRIPKPFKLTKAQDENRNKEFEQLHSKIRRMQHQWDKSRQYIQGRGKSCSQANPEGIRRTK